MLAPKLAGIEVVKDLDLSLPPVPIYGAELNQVWTNLIDNAIQAMDGHGTLTITTSRDGEMVRVEIGDTGPGHPGGDPAADLRAVLHHEAGRPGHRAGARHLLPDRRGPPRRRPVGGVRAGRAPASSSACR